MKFNNSWFLTIVIMLFFVISILAFLILTLKFIKPRVGKDLVADLHQLGGVRVLFTLTFPQCFGHDRTIFFWQVITLEDLEDYEARWVKPVQVG